MHTMLLTERYEEREAKEKWYEEKCDDSVTKERHFKLSQKNEKFKNLYQTRRPHTTAQILPKKKSYTQLS